MSQGFAQRVLYGNDHGELDGLADNDHPQYQLVGGSTFDELTLTPKAASASLAEGTIFYCSTDDHVYVATE